MTMPFSNVPLNPRAAYLISSLGLISHPEGGRFREIYRSPACVKPCDGRIERSALTAIFYLLVAGEKSRWHRVASDEAWLYYEGDPLELFIADPSFDRIERILLGPVGEHTRPMHVVPANAWQAARSFKAYTLTGCTVGPGFEFEDFQMISQFPELAEKVRQQHPEFGSFI
jgi:uncharacterized protein